MGCSGATCTARKGKVYIMKRLLVLTVCVTVQLIAANAYAQHANFVLFGDPNEAGVNQPVEEKHVHPITSPYFNEDAFITTDLRLWYVFHKFPGSSTLAGGEAHVIAVQARLALTDRLALLAVKDGYVWFESGLIDDDGWNDIAAALKYNIIQDFENEFHVSFGVGYEFKTGNGGVLQNDDELRFFVSVNKGFGKLHLGFNLNVFFAVGDETNFGDSDRLQWHLHADYYVCDWFSPVVEVNGYHILNAGTTTLPEQGVDVANVGQGEDDPVVTLGVGFELRCPEAPGLGIRVAFELPLTDNTDIFDYRVTTSVVQSF